MKTQKGRKCLKRTFSYNWKISSKYYGFLKYEKKYNLKNITKKN